MLFVSVAAVGKGDGSDLTIEIREDNAPMFYCDLGTHENCKVSAREREMEGGRVGRRSSGGRKIQIIVSMCVCLCLPMCMFARVYNCCFLARACVCVSVKVQSISQSFSGITEKNLTPSPPPTPSPPLCKRHRVSCYSYWKYANLKLLIIVNHFDLSLHSYSNPFPFRPLCWTGHQVHRQRQHHHWAGELPWSGGWHQGHV